MPSLAAILRPLVALLPAMAGAIAGGYLFYRFDLPAPWISGSMLGAMLTAAIRPLPDMPIWLRDLALLMAGTSMGAGVTPDTVALIGKMPASFALLAISIVAIMYLSSLWLTRVHGWRREDAMLAAAPGALSTVLAIGAARGGDVIGIAVVQTTRLFILMALLPGLIGWMEGAAGAGIVVQSATMSAPVLMITLIAGLALGYAFTRAKIAAAMMLGGALVGAVLHGSGLVVGQPPPLLAIVGFTLVGVMIATRTRGITWAAVRRYAIDSVASLIIGGAVAAALALTAGALLNIRPGATLIAFAPGGVEAMTLLAISLAYDPLYVAAHHIARFMSIGFCLPLYFRFTDRNPPSP